MSPRSKPWVQHAPLTPLTRLYRLAKLTDENEIMVYEHIESTGTNGIWTKTLKQRTNIAQNHITKTTGKLTKEGLIKQVRSVKNPSQKVLMLSHLSPSEGISGGPWHSEGELDMELIGVTADAVIQFIEQKSWVKGYIKRERSASPFDATGDGSRKRKRPTADGDIEGVHTKARRTYKVETQLSYPPGYSDYPTVGAVLHFIREAGFVKNSDALTETDIQSMLDVLIFDDRIEKIGGGYRTVRGVTGATEAMKNMTAGRSAGELGEDGEGNGLTQAPCGRCPVFDLCEEGGPVNARNCVYFDAWLRA